MKCRRRGLDENEQETKGFNMAVKERKIKKVSSPRGEIALRVWGFKEIPSMRCHL
jgi:hypothetical protein